MEDKLMTKVVCKIIQISDSHMFSDKQTTLLGINTYYSFLEIIKNITENLPLFPPDFIFLTGDVSQDYSRGSYETVAKILSDLPGKQAAILGNHDDPVFAKYLYNKSISDNRVFVAHNWKFILLNSHWSVHVAGKLETKELEFLVKELENGADKNIMIFIHHHILPVDSYWLDKIGLSNDQQFLEVIDKHDNIKAVVSGHVHQESCKIRNNVAFITTPSTSLQFATFSHNFGVDNLMPGYRRIELYDNGSFTTEVVRMPYNEKFISDRNSLGY